jgi:hypothetical protein
MYQFNIGQEADGSYRFERNGIYLVVDAFEEKEGKHYIQNPARAMAFFKTGGNLYGISNSIITHTTVEEFFDSMSHQFDMFGAAKQA